MQQLSRLSDTLSERARPALEVAVQAALQAGELLRAGYNQTHEVQDKGFGDLVSQIDVACDRAIQAVIRDTYPDELIISEELSPDVKPPATAHWVVDPLDASSAYLYHIADDLPAVLIARRGGQAPEVGVAYFPLTDELFYAVKGSGAYKEQQRLRCPPSPPLSQSWVELNQFSDARLESVPFKTLRNRLRRPGGARLVTSNAPYSGAGVRLVEGRRKLAAVVHDNHARDVKQAPWDVIPVALIVEEAGGVVMNLRGEAYDPFAAEPYLMAASRELAAAIIGLAAEESTH